MTHYRYRMDHAAFNHAQMIAGRMAEVCAAAGALSLAASVVGLFAIWKLWTHRRQIELVHAVDLDTAIPALVANRLWGLPFIFDIYDHYADSRGLSGRSAWLANWIEHRAIDRLIDAVENGEVSRELIDRGLPDRRQRRAVSMSRVNTAAWNDTGPDTSAGSCALEPCESSGPKSNRPACASCRRGRRSWKSKAKCTVMQP